MSRLLRDVLLKFVSPTAMVSKLPWEVDFTLSYNRKSDKELLIGDVARQFIASKESNGLTDVRVKEFHQNVVAYYVAVANYLKSNLPFDSPVLQHIKVCSVAELGKEGAISTSLPVLLQHFQSSLPAGCSTDDLVNEFADLQAEPLSADTFERQDHFWASILKQHRKRFQICVQLHAEPAYNPTQLCTL